MQLVGRTLILMSLAAAAGCSTTTGAPATTPTSVAPVTAAAPGTVISTTTTSTIATTTTIDRLAEIGAIFEDLERRRLQAIFDQDEEAFRALYANDAYLRESLPLLQLVAFEGNPSNAEISTLEVLFDTEECLTALLSTDLTAVVRGGGLGEKQQSLQTTAEGWGISYVGEDWACDGPHPLS